MGERGAIATTIAVVMAAVLLLHAGAVLGAGMDGAAEEAARAILVPGEGKRPRIFLAPGDFVADDGNVYRFSLIWRENLAAALAKAGAVLVPAPDQAAFRVTGRYWRLKDAVVVNIKMVDLSDGSTLRIAKVKLDGGGLGRLFEKDLSVYAEVLADELAYQLGFLGDARLVAEPFRLRGRPEYPPFSNMFLEEIKAALCKRGFRFIERAAFSAGMRGVRGISVVSSGPGSIARPYRLGGSIWPDGAKIRVFVKVFNVDAGTSAEARAVIPASLVSPADLTAPGEWAGDSPVDGTELRVQIMPDRGEGAVYRLGESVFFSVVVNRDAHVHVYDVNAKGIIVPLFPCRGSGDGGGRVSAASVNFLPRAGEWRVSEPKGVDRVLVFASTGGLVLPDGARCGEVLSMPLDRLFSHYRAQGHGRGYAEGVATIVVK